MGYLDIIIEKESHILVKAGVVFFLIFIFFFFLSILDSATNFFPNVNVSQELANLWYLLFSGIQLILNLTLIIFRENGAGIWVNDLFTWLAKVFSWVGSSVLTLISDFLLGIFQFVGNILAEVELIDQNKIWCVGSCDPIPDVDVPTNHGFYGDVWAYLNFNNGDFQIGARAGSYNEIWFNGELWAIQHDRVFVVGGIIIPQINVYLDFLLFFSNPDPLKNLNILGGLNSYLKEVHESLPSWYEIHTLFLNFGGQ